MLEKNFAAGELKEGAVQWEAQKGWRKVRQRCVGSGWWCLLDEIITEFRRGRSRAHAAVPAEKRCCRLHQNSTRNRQASWLELGGSPAAKFFGYYAELCYNCCVSKTNSLDEDWGFQSLEGREDKADQQPSIDRVVEIHSQLNSYSGPRDERALQQKLHQIEEQYSLPDSLDIPEERHAQLEGKKREELAATREEFSRYQGLRREAIRLDIEKKKQELFTWAREAGIPNEDIFTGTRKQSKKQWETEELIIVIDKKHYSKVLTWLQSSPTTKIDFSAAGRMAAYDLVPDGSSRRYAAFRDFGFFERNSDGERIGRTHHAAFKEFTASRGIAIPSGKEVQQKLQAVNRELYNRALATIDQKMQNADEGEQRRLWKLKEKVKALPIYIEQGVDEPKEIYNLDRKELPGDPVTNYNDLIYNADCCLSEQEWEELGIPEKDRLFFVDGEKMETLCREFGEHLLRRGFYQ